MYNREQTIFLTIVSLFIILLTLFFVICVMNSCTYNISMVHTQGQADDVIDTTQAADPNISPDINIAPIS